MLRNHCGWAWRPLVAVLFLLFLYSSTAMGGPLIGIPPLKPVVPTGPQLPTYAAPTSYMLDGYVYMDSAHQGVKIPGEWGLPNVQLRLAEYSSTNPQTIIKWYTAYTDNSGFYSFSGLDPSTSTNQYFYTLLETQPTGYTSTANTIGHFMTSSGGSLAAPPGYIGVPSNGLQTPSMFPDTMYFITMPPATGAFAPSSTGGKYCAINYNFGEFALMTGGSTGGIGKPPIGPSPPGTSGGTTTVPAASLTTNLAVVGNNDRFLAGAGAGSLPVTATVRNSANPGSSALDWKISGLSTGLNLAPAAGTSLGAGNSTALSGVINGAGLVPGTQNATFTVTGTNSGKTTTLTPSTTSVPIDPVLSRGIDSVTSANFGRLMQGSTATSSVAVTSAGIRDKYSDLTMNNGASAAGADANGNFVATNGAAVTFNGTTTTNPNVTVNAAFSNTALGPVTATASIAGNTGLFTSETLAAGTPTLPTLQVPYTATLLQPRQFAAPTSFAVPSETGGLLYGAVVPVPAGYVVTSSNANADSNHATMVYVGGSSPSGESVTSVATDGSGTPVGQVDIAQTKVSSGVQAVSVRVGAYALGPISGSASVTVVSAEAASVHDTTNYAPVGLAYTISNVGFAATGGVDPINPNAQLFGAKLSAPFTAGQAIAPSAIGTSLTSVVATAGTAGAASTSTGYSFNTLSTSPTVDATNFAGAVGSVADILASTALSTSANVTMSWRNRDNSENGTFTDPSWSTKLPQGIQWLASDVVNIGGVPNDLTYAMQMSYDDRINTLLDGPGGTATVVGSYLGKLVGSGTGAHWVNAISAAAGTTAGPHAQFAVGADQPGGESLYTFLSANLYDPINNPNGYTLDQLAGSWGVDLGSQESWAIVNGGGGQFAVVPEPSTLALLVASAIGLLAYRLRRKTRIQAIGA